MADHMNNVVADLASVFTRGGQAKYRGEFRLVGSIVMLSLIAAYSQLPAFSIPTVHASPRMLMSHGRRG